MIDVKKETSQREWLEGEFQSILKECRSKGGLPIKVIAQIIRNDFKDEKEFKVLIDLLVIEKGSKVGEKAIKNEADMHIGSNVKLKSGKKYE